MNAALLLALLLQPDVPRRLDLAPARWIWFPSARALPSTFVLFRREIEISRPLVRAAGWITADSRYRLTVDGRWVQWGPAPSDPRHLDVDPLDLRALLTPGKHTLGVEVLYYGRGDGTYVAGKPGLLFRLELEYEDGTKELVCSDERWLSFLDRAHAPGRPRRWYLRALQEEFDARLHPRGWDRPGFAPDAAWLPAMLVEGRADHSSLALRYPDAQDDMSVAAGTSLRARQIPLLRREDVDALRLARSFRVRWLRDPRDWFESRTPGSFQVEEGPGAVELEPGVWELPEGGTATFEFKEGLVGWPYFTIDAAAGTVVELMVQEGHEPSKGNGWLDTHFHAWTRFICAEGTRRYETFDYEALRWLQLHVRNASRPARLRGVGVARRLYPFANEPRVKLEDPALQRLADACVNTMRLSMQDHVVDGMGRERQQYPGDAGHQNAAARLVFGETRLSRRFLRTFSEGITLDGYFMDCWPGTDRLRRIGQRQIGAYRYGPLVDEGLGFVQDAWSYYLDTGDLDALREPYPRILRFAETLERWRGADGLLPVEDFGTPSVWMDRNDCYPKQRYKQCAYNLYAAATLRHALAPLARAFGDDARARRAESEADAILAAAVRAFWCPERKLFVVNRPWLADEKGPRFCDRSLANAILYDQCPGGETAAVARALVEPPPDMGLAYPANTLWRHRALCKLERQDVVLREFRERWATLPSVRLNNTVQETWTIRGDSTDLWSHCAVFPVQFLLSDILGLRPLEPGYRRYEIRPRLAGLGDAEAVAHTPLGPFEFRVRGERLDIVAPPGGEGTLALPDGPRPLAPGRTSVILRP